MSRRQAVILVTGASKGIGLAVTQILLTKFNAKVIALSRTQSAELVQLESPSLLFCKCDVSDDNALKKAVALGLDTFKYLDGLVLNAGQISPLGNIGGGSTLDEWKQHFDVNFFSLVSALKATLPALRTSELGGKVIFVSSGSSMKGQAGAGPYNTSKAAMNGLCRTLGSEESNIVSVAIRPGVVDTNMQDVLRSADGLAPTEHQFYVDLQANKKLLHPNVSGHVIASMAMFAPSSLSGQYVSWDADELKEFRA